MILNEIAKQIANHAGMPYTWEDVLNRLKHGIALPFKLTELPQKPPNEVDAAMCACGATATYGYIYGVWVCSECGKPEPPQC